MKPSDRDALERVAVALDTSDWSTFERWCELFGPRVGVLKIGLEAYVRWGRPAVELGLEHGRAVFLDLKLHDIPNTVAGAVGAVGDLGVRYLTVHAAGGPAMLEAAARAADDSVRLLAVTVLTHLDAEALSTLDLPGSSRDRAASWAGMASMAGCSGAVCSPLEAARLREQHTRDFELVTPGVRFTPGSECDQKRVATPEDAIRNGADLLVIGRPLTAAPNPEATLDQLAERLQPVSSVRR